ncbi:hypothetical protein GN956_G18610 [Arapaima gigas]
MVPKTRRSFCSREPSEGIGSGTRKEPRTDRHTVLPSPPTEPPDCEVILSERSALGFSLQKPYRPRADRRASARSLQFPSVTPHTIRHFSGQNFRGTRRGITSATFRRKSYRGVLVPSKPAVKAAASDTDAVARSPARPPRPSCVAARIPVSSKSGDKQSDPNSGSTGRLRV